MTALEVAVPREWMLNANQRLHWREKGERSRWLRNTARLLSNPRCVYADRMRCEVVVSWPNARRRDVHNLMPTIKACIDGLVDAGVLADDSDKYLVGPDLRVSDQLCDKRYACTLTFRFTPAEVAA
jgi:crossover junction endodeoxyribonuclease RusA